MAENVENILVPDIGGAVDVAVIEILVAPGDQVQVESPLITLEGDKAAMEVPSPSAGTVKAIQVKIGDKVSQGSVILALVTAHAQPEEQKEKVSTPQAPTEKKSPPSSPPAPQSVEKPEASPATDGSIHAGPAVRRLARELEIDLTQVRGSGEKGRITKEDLKNHLKGQATRGTGLGSAPAPVVDFSKFGEIETKPLGKIQKISGANLHRNWVTIPHVTQFAEADITELEAFRERHKEEAMKQGIRLTPLVFIMKAVVAALKEYPRFNASLDSSGENLVMKKYFHLGVAVDTPNGLVVPVIRHVDSKSIYELAQELGSISQKARETGLSLADMQGGCFTISSLGGLGGAAFTPIINAPEVAILGVSRSEKKPVYQKEGTLLPRLLVPLSLSYDHRVLDGADAARFIVFLSQCLSDIRSLLLH